eukprot:1917036-Alexandrium_andersonii.AAC.1
MWKPRGKRRMKRPRAQSPQPMLAVWPPPPLLLHTQQPSCMDSAEATARYLGQTSSSQARDTCTKHDFRIAGRSCARTCT